MTKAIESGMPKYRIEEAAARRQAMIDSGREVIVGMNKYHAESEKIDVRHIDNKAVLASQEKRLKKLKDNRSETDVQKYLNQITEAAKTQG